MYVLLKQSRFEVLVFMLIALSNFLSAELPISGGGSAADSVKPGGTNPAISSENNDLLLLNECIKNKSCDPFLERIRSIVIERAGIFIRKMSMDDGPFIDINVSIDSDAKPENRSRDAFQKSFITCLKEINNKKSLERYYPDNPDFESVNTFIHEIKGEFKAAIKLYILSFVKDEKDTFLAENINLDFVRFDADHTPPRDHTAGEFFRALVEYIFKGGK